MQDQPRPTTPTDRLMEEFLARYAALNPVLGEFDDGPAAAPGQHYQTYEE